MQDFRSTWNIGEVIRLQNTTEYPITGGIIVGVGFGNTREHYDIFGDEDMKVHERVPLECICIRPSCSINNLAEMVTCIDNIGEARSEFKLMEPKSNIMNEVNKDLDKYIQNRDKEEEKERNSRGVFTATINDN